jgi:DNA-directed RNA polymerase specialized sigma24 family protein
VDRIRSGDRAAFDELYQRYFKRVYAFLDKRLRNRWDTEETTQEVFINIFASLYGYRGVAPFAAWVLAHAPDAGRTIPAQTHDGPLMEEDEERSSRA